MNLLVCPPLPYLTIYRKVVEPPLIITVRQRTWIINTKYTESKKKVVALPNKEHVTTSTGKSIPSTINPLQCIFQEWQATSDFFTTGSIVIFHNKSLTPLKIDNNKYADVSTVFLQSSSGQKKKRKRKQYKTI